MRYFRGNNVPRHYCHCFSLIEMLAAMAMLSLFLTFGFAAFNSINRKSIKSVEKSFSNQQVLLIRDFMRKHVKTCAGQKLEWEKGALYAGDNALWMEQGYLQFHDGKTCYDIKIPSDFKAALNLEAPKGEEPYVVLDLVCREGTFGGAGNQGTVRIVACPGKRKEGQDEKRK